MADFENSCSDLVSVLQERYKGWEGAEQFGGTSERISRMYEEFCWPPERIKAELEKQFHVFSNGYDEMLVSGPSTVWTLCPHHLLPILLKVWIGYIPSGKVLGLSKFTRIAVIMGKRPIMQEQYVDDLANILMDKLKPKGVGVYIEGEHGCMMSRGIQQDQSVSTSAQRGIFLDDASARAEFFAIVRGMK